MQHVMQLMARGELCAKAVEVFCRELTDVSRSLVVAVTRLDTGAGAAGRAAPGLVFDEPGATIPLRIEWRSRLASGPGNCDDDDDWLTDDTECAEAGAEEVPSMVRHYALSLSEISSEPELARLVLEDAVFVR